MKLYIEGHAIRKGWGITVCYSNAEVSAMEYTDVVDMPVRFIQSREKARKLVARWNRRFATH